VERKAEKLLLTSFNKKRNHQNDVKIRKDALKAFKKCQREK